MSKFKQDLQDLLFKCLVERKERHSIKKYHLYYARGVSYTDGLLSSVDNLDDSIADEVINNSPLKEIISGLEKINLDYQSKLIIHDGKSSLQGKFLFTDEPPLIITPLNLNLNVNLSQVIEIKETPTTVSFLLPYKRKGFWSSKKNKNKLLTGSATRLTLKLDKDFGSLYSLIDNLDNIKPQFSKYDNNYGLESLELVKKTLELDIIIVKEEVTDQWKPDVNTDQVDYKHHLRHNQGDLNKYYSQVKPIDGTLRLPNLQSSLSVGDLTNDNKDHYATLKLESKEPSHYLLKMGSIKSILTQEELSSIIDHSQQEFKKYDLEILKKRLKKI